MREQTRAQRIAPGCDGISAQERPASRAHHRRKETTTRSRQLTDRLDDRTEKGGARLHHKNTATKKRAPKQKREEQGKIRDTKVARLKTRDRENRHRGKNGKTKKENFQQKHNRKRKQKRKTEQREGNKQEKTAQCKHGQIGREGERERERQREREVGGTRQTERNGGTMNREDRDKRKWEGRKERERGEERKTSHTGCPKQTDAY
jgi:hypothetical protein